MDLVALVINLTLFCVFTIGLIMLSASEARQGKKAQEEFKKAA